MSIVDSARGAARLGRGRVSGEARPRRSGLRDAVARRAHERARRGDEDRARARRRWPARASRRSRSTPPAPRWSRWAKGLVPLDDYYLWCDHRAHEEAALITRVAQDRMPRRHRCLRRRLFVASGASPSCCTGCGTIRRSAARSSPRSSTATWSPRCSAASPIPTKCRAASARWGTSGSGTATCRPQEFLAKVDPLLAGARDVLRGRYLHLRTHRRDDSRRRGRRSSGLREGIPIPVGAFDAHWDAIGAGIAEGDVVNVVGTATLHHGDREEDGAHPGALRRGEGVDPSGSSSASRPDCRPPATCSRRSRRAAAGASPSSRRGWSRSARARPDCCTSRGTTATAPCS